MTIFGEETNRERIDAVASIFLGVAFARKHMTEVAVAVSAADLGPPAVGIRNLLYGTREMIIKSWPAATGIKFGLSREEGAIALAAEIGAIFEKTVIFSLKRGFSPLLEDNAGFFLTERVVTHTTIITHEKSGLKKPLL